MYKKISHNIVEEHFEHPASLPAGMIDNSQLSQGQHVSKYALLWNNFITFNTDLRSYIKSELADSADNEFNWTRLNITVTDFKSTLFLPYSQQASGQIIVDHLTGYVTTIKEILLAIKDKQDYSTQQALALTHLVDLSHLLETLIDGWRRTPVSFELNLTNYNRSVIAEIVARYAQDWSADYAASGQALAALSNMNQTPYYGN